MLGELDGAYVHVSEYGYYIIREGAREGVAYPLQAAIYTVRRLI